MISSAQDPNFVTSDSANAHTSSSELAAAGTGLQPVYFISGLGADQRIFQWLRYDSFKPVHIQWIDPERTETVESYAKRLSAQIETDAPVIVGLSFGGIVAVELGKQIPDSQIVLLSSVKNRSEVPFYYKAFQGFPVHRIFPFKSMLWASYWFAYWLFSPEGANQRKLFRTILQETDPHFLKWALHKVVTWRNQAVPEGLVHIHGKRDRVFPFRFVSPDVAVDNSGHLMVMNRAEAISDLLEQLILKSPKAS